MVKALLFVGDRLGIRDEVELLQYGCSNRVILYEQNYIVACTGWFIAGLRSPKAGVSGK